MNEQTSPLLKSITLQGFLSFGPEAVTIPLTGLNVIFGPNGSGKSNLIEAVSVLRAVPKDLPLPIRRGGGVRDWLWKSGKRELRREDIDPTQSILSQRRDPDAFPELTRFADLLRKILIYRSWQFGPNSVLRASCRPDVPTGHLSEEFDNLPPRLAVLKRAPAVKKRLVELLGDLAPGFDDLGITPESGQLQLYLSENGRMFPARRLSDGSLRFLCLLAILLDPTPPPLVVIEEPELGLHPDVLPILRDLLVDAGNACQLIVTTHSTQLVDAMTEHADSVLVCDKQENTTSLSRLTQQEVDRWREHGSLGSLWLSGSSLHSTGCWVRPMDRESMKSTHECS